jgi:hypothetical protein
MSQPNHKPKDDLVNDFDLWVGVIKNLNGRFFSIPWFDAAKQEEIIDHYQKELSTYKEAINKAENRWSTVKDNIYKQLF